MTAPPGPPGLTDAELVARVLAADREAFATVYDRYGNRLYDFAYSMMRHREDAADAVADSFVTFAERLTQLRDPDRLRPWLYAVVRSECLRRLKARKRVAYGDDEALVEMADDATTPEEPAERAALQQLVWDASAGLAGRDRAILDLHLRQGLDGAELGEAMGVSAANAYVMLNRLRAQVDRSLGALLIARRGRDDCAALDAVLAGWDGGFSPLVRKRVARHVDQCDVCGERRRKMVSPWMLLAGVPMFAAPLGLRDRVVNDTQLVAYDMSGPPAGSTGAHRMAAPRNMMLVAVALVLAVVISVWFWPSGAEDDPATQAATTTPSATATSAVPSTDPSPMASAPPGPATTASATPSATSEPLPGALVLSTHAINLGRRASRATFTLTNTGELPAVYQVSSRTGWLGVTSNGGKLAGGSAAQVTLQADRSALPEGVSAGRIRVTWGGGSATVKVTLDEEGGPVVDAPTVPAGSSCDVAVTVRATDESGVSGVRLAWTGPASGTARMVRSGTLWSATIHITVGGRYTLTATATDTRGNTSTGPARTVAINPCPQ